MSTRDPDLATARRAMVLNQLRPEGVADPAVLAAMATVPREEFLPANLRALAYADRPLKLDGGAPVMAPAGLGRLLTRLAPLPGERALVVGEGGAYSAAVLRHIGLAVETTPGAEAPGKGDYDLILIEGAIDEVPSAHARRLAPGGRIGAAIVEDGVTRLAIGRGAGKSLAFASFADASVPPLPGFARAPAFTF